MGCFESKPSQDYTDYGPRSGQRADYGPPAQGVDYSQWTKPVPTKPKQETQTVPSYGPQATAQNAYPNNKYELIITLSVKIEKILKRKYNATGKGLGELINSVEEQLDASLVKQLRAMNTVRNKLAHQGIPPADTRQYIANYEAVLRRL